MDNLERDRQIHLIDDQIDYLNRLINWHSSPLRKPIDIRPPWWYYLCISPWREKIKELEENKKYLLQ